MMPAMGSFTRSADEQMLINAFECIFDDVGGYPFIFSPASLNPENKQGLLALIGSGEPLHHALDRYVRMEGADSPKFLNEKTLGKQRPRFQMVSGGLQCLMGMPEYKDRVLSFIMNDYDCYTRISKGMFGHNYSNFSSVFLKHPNTPISNFCRDKAGSLLSMDSLDRLILSVHDANAMLVSAVANRDLAGVLHLTDSLNFSIHLNRTDTLARVAGYIRQYPKWDLEPALGALVKENSNSLFMADVQNLLGKSGSTKDEFHDAFWPGAHPSAINQLIIRVLGDDRADVDSASSCLQVFAENGVDFYMACLHVRSGVGAMLDAESEPVDQGARNRFVMQTYLNYSSNGSRPKAFGALLINLPLEMLADHPQSERLLLERYRITQDKTILSYGSQAMRGRVLQDELGM
jgi:hypothetical protein